MSVIWSFLEYLHEEWQNIATHYNLADKTPTGDPMDAMGDAISKSEVVLVPAAATLFSAALSVLSTMDLSFLKYPKQATVYDGQRFDFIVVGAGSAGCVIANRLSELNVTVALMEAGGDPPVDSVIPGFFPFLTYSKEDWGYFTEDDGYSSQALKRKRIHMTRGKTLGGSSSFNLMYYARGEPADYNDWGWDWDDVLEHFKKSERMNNEVIEQGPTSDYHNYSSLLGVTRPDWGDTFKLNDVLAGFEENGHEILLDYNGPKLLGYAKSQFTIDRNIRQSTAAAFLSPIKDRKNLYLLKKTLARKILFKRKKAIGVEVKQENGKIISLYANREIIISAGAINSPQLLMVSGIGPKRHLRQHGIRVLVDSPNVGQNLQDHPTVLVTMTGDKNVKSVVQNVDVLTNLNKMPIPSFMGFSSYDQPDGPAKYQAMGFLFPAGTVLSTLICSLVYGIEDYICENVAKAGQFQEQIFTTLILLHPESKGEIKLQSKDPEVKPLIYAKYFSEEKDLDDFAYYMADYVSVVKTEKFQQWKSEVVDYKIKQCRHLEFGCHEYWKCHILNIVHTIWHPAGTCVMSEDDDSVVDMEFSVRGVENLRVADASIMRTEPSGNTNAPSIMIGERAADAVKRGQGFI